MGTGPTHVENLERKLFLPSRNNLPDSGKDPFSPRRRVRKEGQEALLGARTTVIGYHSRRVPEQTNRRGALALHLRAILRALAITASRSPFVQVS